MIKYPSECPSGAERSEIGWGARGAEEVNLEMWLQQIGHLDHFVLMLPILVTSSPLLFFTTIKVVFLC